MNAGAKWIKWLTVAFGVAVVSPVVMMVFGPVGFTIVVIVGALYSAPMFIRALAATYPTHFRADAFEAARKTKNAGKLPLALLLLVVGAARPGEAEAAVYLDEAPAVCVGVDFIAQEC